MPTSNNKSSSTKSEDRKWILVVDDEKEIRESVVEFIKLNCGDDVRVVEAVDGLDATSKINYQKFHCIITDMRMPKKEGEAFITSVRNNQYNDLTPVIIISGFVQKEIENQFPFVYFVGKPFNSFDLLELVKQQLKMGSTKTRLSAGVFNDLVQLTSEFLEKMVDQEKVKIGMAAIKGAGEEVRADYVSNIEVKIGKVQNTFSVLSTKENLEKIVVKIGQEGNDLRKVYRLMNYVIIKHVMSKNGVISIDRFSAESITSDRGKLKNKKGIIIPLQIEDINLEIFATTA